MKPRRICYAPQVMRFALLLVSGALVACQSDAGPPADPLAGSGNVVQSDADYPTDDIGTAVGNVIPNFCFPGFVDPVASMEKVEICLSNFYNPTGDGTYGEDDPFPDGTPLPKLVVIDVSGKWCSPCKYEAQHVLPGVWSSLGPKGLLLLAVLADGSKPTVPATLEDLAQWSAAFQPRYPNVIDPKYQMGALFDSSQFPAFFIVDATTMKIVQFVGGKPPETFWEKVEELL